MFKCQICRRSCSLFVCGQCKHVDERGRGASEGRRRCPQWWAVASSKGKACMYVVEDGCVSTSPSDVVDLIR